MTKTDTIEQVPDTLHLPEKNKRRLAKDLQNRAALVIMSGREFGSTFVFKRHATLIGRLKKCDITLDDQSISKVHCSILMDDDGICSVDDMVSTNTTFLNGKKLRRSKVLTTGDSLIIGNTVLLFLESVKTPE